MQFKWVPTTYAFIKKKYTGFFFKIKCDSNNDHQLETVLQTV